MRMRFLAGFAAAALIVGAGAVGSGYALAETSTKDIVKDRQAKMKEIGKLNKDNADAVKAEASQAGSLKPATVAENAAKLHDLSLHIVEWFPKGSGPADGIDTQAKPEIWDKWDDFKKAAADLTKATTDLKTVADKGDTVAIQTAQGEVGKACGGCHRPFQAKKS